MFRAGQTARLSGSAYSLPVLVLAIWATAVPPVSALTDPTRPSSYRAASKSQSLRLESILFSDNRRVAVINGAVVSEGDTVGRIKILQIDKNSVRVNNSGNIVELVLHRAAIRREK